MLRKGFDSSGYGQLRWVILLLAIAVILPTVCLLWFMSQAVKNVQLAARQKLITLYEEKLDKASQMINQSWSQQFEQLDKRVNQNGPLDLFDNLFEARHYSVIVYNEDGRRIYPLLSADVKLPVDPAEQFREAWRLEFAEQRLIEAIRLYEIESQLDNTYVRLSSLIGKARCLAKLGSSDQAVALYKKVAFCPEEATCDTATLMLIANTRLLLAELRKPTLKQAETLTDSTFRDELSKLLHIIGERNEAGAVLPLDRSLFLAHRWAKLVEDINNLVLMNGEMYRGMDSQSLTGVLNEGELTLAVAERFPTAAELRDWPVDQFRQLQLDEQTLCYGAKHNVGEKTILLLQLDQISGVNYENDFRGTGVAYRVIDNLGRVAGGLERSSSRPFLTTRIGQTFADWQVELYFEDNDIFAGAAQRQITLYVWAGVLVIVLILATGSFAGQALGKQMRLNRLKNDFIATVSHELKTPLASMRVLADTLLAGNYQDEKQATEYLQLICKENKRLSGLIDNFLSFSRMERNKQAFEMVKTSPAAIANSAAEALRTKFNGGQCEFQVQIAEDLPDVRADQNAMVTVLVNLLDNAYKYSADDKKISLNVSAEGDSVFFCVCDNGVGMSRRGAKKIFERFYQVDRSLARGAEGCGLGLSIVKFIIDAHQGSISVDSNPGEGSTFTVKLPVVK